MMIFLSPDHFSHKIYVNLLIFNDFSSIAHKFIVIWLGIFIFYKANSFLNIKITTLLNSVIFTLLIFFKNINFLNSVGARNKFWGYRLRHHCFSKFGRFWKNLGLSWTYVETYSGIPLSRPPIFWGGSQLGDPIHVCIGW